LSRLLVALAAAAVFAATLGTRDFIRDDRLLIAENQLLRQGWKAAPQIMTTGYWEMILGRNAPIQEYRPLLALSYLLHFTTTGAAAWPMHAANIALHCLVCVLLLEALRRRLGARAALAAALLFAVMPIHAEAVCYITSRSELLAAASVLAAWLLLEKQASGPRLAWGTAIFCAGMLSKEHVVLFPAFLALSDWAFHGRKPWERERRRTHLILAACAAAYMALRWSLLTHTMHGGVAYFHDRLVALLTFSRFALQRYLWPSVSGANLCADFSRPLLPDASPASVGAWLALAAWTALAAAAARAWLRRACWAFWILGPGLFLLPTCHLFFPLDSIGAERFLYLPSVGLAALLGMLFAWAASRWRTAARLTLAALILWYARASVERSRVWLSQRSYYEAALRCNPVSANALSSLGAALLESGETGRGETLLLQAAALDPALARPVYNLGRLAWQRADLNQAEALLEKALRLDATFTDARVLLALCREKRKRLDDAAALLERALADVPWHAAAEFNLGRVEMLRGRPAAARAHFLRFAQLAPDDPDARQAMILAGSLRP